MKCCVNQKKWKTSVIEAV